MPEGLRRVLPSDWRVSYNRSCDSESGLAGLSNCMTLEPIAAADAGPWASAGALAEGAWRGPGPNSKAEPGAGRDCGQSNLGDVNSAFSGRKCSRGESQPIAARAL